MVRVAGFEPTASWSRTMRATNCATPGYNAKGALCLLLCGEHSSTWFFIIRDFSYNVNLYFVGFTSGFCQGLNAEKSKMPFCVLFTKAVPPPQSLPPLQAPAIPARHTFPQGCRAGIRLPISGPVVYFLRYPGKVRSPRDLPPNHIRFPFSLLPRSKALYGWQ